FFGDGAVNEGSFHEAFNLASIWQVPVVFVCENNEYGMSSSIKKMTNITHLASRAEAYGFPGRTIDGNDVSTVKEITGEAIARARSGKGPTFIEMKTYRFKGHSRSDKEVYRTREEVISRKQKDPIVRFERQLLAENIVQRSTIDKINK